MKAANAHGTALSEEALTTSSGPLQVAIGRQLHQVVIDERRDRLDELFEDCLGAVRAMGRIRPRCDSFEPSVSRGERRRPDRRHRADTA